MKSIIRRIIIGLFFIIGISSVIASKASAANIVYTDKEIYKPGETITVTYIVDNTNVFGNRPWIGLLPAEVSHGSEYINDQHDIAYYHVSAKSQVLTFTAPSRLGTYDFRLHDTDYSGREIAASDVFRVSNEDTVSVSSVRLNRSNISLKVGEKSDLVSVISPQNATNKRVIWSSSDSSVASVDSQGQILGLKEGMSEITCTTINGRKTSICKVCVSKEGSIFDLQNNSGFVKLGDDVNIDVLLKDKSSILKEDIVIEYDSNKLKFLGTSNGDGVRIVKQINKSGKLRVLCSNKNIDNSVGSLLFNLRFKSIGVGANSIRISSARAYKDTNEIFNLDNSQLADNVIFISE